MPTGEFFCVSSPSSRSRNFNSGFTYIGLLLLIAISSAGLAMLGERWSTTLHRGREAELHFRGQEIKRAIASYLAASAPQGQALPTQLQDLLEDSRSGESKRHLRRIYTDPFTGQADWELIRAETGGGLIGVRSRAQVPAMNTKGLQPIDAARKALVSDFEFSISEFSIAGSSITDAASSQLPATSSKPQAGGAE